MACRNPKKRHSIAMQGKTGVILLVLIASLVLISTTFLPPTLHPESQSEGIFQRPFNQTYGGTNSDWVSTLIQTVDGGFVLAGSTNSFGAGREDMWLVKTDVTGNVTWHQTYGGTECDEANAMVQTIDGGFALAGYTRSFGSGNKDMWLVKTDVTGNVSWYQTYGGPDVDIAYALVQTIDGGFALAGATSSSDEKNYFSNMWLVKTDANGVILWNQTYGKDSYDGGSVLIQTTDGGFVLAGYTSGEEGPDMRLVKTDASGMMMWYQTYRESGWFEVTAIVQAVDGGFALTGGLKTHHGSGCMLCASGAYPEGKNMLLLKTDANGVMTWHQSYGGPDVDNPTALVQTTDGGFALTGWTESFGVGDRDIWLVKTDANGVMTWNQTYGGPNEDRPSALVQTIDGGFALAGSTESFGVGGEGHDMWLVKTDANGVMTWNQSCGVTDTNRLDQSLSSTTTSIPGWGFISLLVATVVLTTWYKRHKKLE